MKLATGIGGVCIELDYLDQTRGKPAILIVPNAGGWGDLTDSDNAAVRADRRAGVINLEASRDISSLTDEEV